MEWLTDPTAWAGLLTLIVLEIVLGIDNLVFIAILADKLPEHQRDRARVIGLSLALAMRLILLASISWLVSLTRPVLWVLEHSFSWRDIIMLGGGMFLLFKATIELHERLEGRVFKHPSEKSTITFWPLIAQIVVLDAVFSLDAVITAVGMVDHVSIMMLAVIVAIGLMIVASKPLTVFINAHPTLIVLCLGFLMMIGFSLTAEGLGFHIPKGYLYSAIGFSIFIEIINQVSRLRRKKNLQEQMPLRQRTAYSVMRLLGGKPIEAVTEDIVDMVDTDEREEVFDRQERIMISGVLNLNARPVKSIMTTRTETDFIDISEEREVIVETLINSPYSRLPALPGGSEDAPIGVLHKKEVLRELLTRSQLQPASLVREVPHLPESATILSALEQMRDTSTHIAFVYNEFGDFVGIVTMTDILEFIAGELPDASESSGPDIVVEDDGYNVSGSINLANLKLNTGFSVPTSSDYRTLGGLIMDKLERLPVAGDQLDLDGWTLRVLSVEDRRVSRVFLQSSAQGASA